MLQVLDGELLPVVRVNLASLYLNLLQEDICKAGNIVWKSSKTLVMDPSAIQKIVKVASIRNG